jgi:transcriptional regulator with XRE-family HTH domain
LTVHALFFYTMEREVSTLVTLRQLREGRLLTQSELAEALDVTTGAISQIERGLSRPRFKLARRICDYFGIEPSELELPKTREGQAPKKVA